MAETTSADALAPCPFCGKGPHADGKWGVGVGCDEAGKEFGVICSGCGASSSLTCESKSAAIAAWNRRALPIPEIGPHVGVGQEGVE